MKIEKIDHDLDALYEVLNTLSVEINKYNKLSGKVTSIVRYGPDYNFPSSWSLKVLIQEFILELDKLYELNLDDLEVNDEVLVFEELKGLPLTDNEIIELNFIRISGHNEAIYNEAIKKLRLKYNG